MNNCNIRFLRLASLSLFVALAPLACGSDDDDDSAGTAGKTGTGGTSTAGKSAGGSAGNSGSSTGGTSGTGGSNAVGGDGVSGGQGGEGGAAVVEKARLRVVHASPSAPAVDIYLKGAATAAVENVEYGAATEFIEVDAGTIAFDLRAAGEAASSDPAFTSEDITLAGDADYTLVAAGDFEHADDADVGFRILPFEHDFDAAEAGTALARVVHATSGWEDVDFDVGATDDVDVPGLPRFGSESNVALPSAKALDVSFASTAGVVSQLVLPKLADESQLFVIATGNPGMPFRAPANGFALLVVDQDGKTSWVKENPWLHLVHASDIGPVDIYESAHATTRLADDVAAEAMVAFQLAASTPGYTLRAVDSGAANGSASGLANGGTSTLLAGEHYLSYIAGSTIQTIQEQFDLTQPTKVLLRGVHAAKPGQIPSMLDFGPVVSDALSGTIITGVGPAEASAEEGEAINPGNLILGATATTTTTPVLASITLSGAAAPKAGERDFVLLTGTAAAAKLFVVTTSQAGWSIR
jgi:hypothetical protein